MLMRPSSSDSASRSQAAHEGITVQIYGQRSTGHDREAAELVAKLIRQRLDEQP